MKTLMTIATVAKVAGVSVDTVRYYERVGLLPKPARTPAGYRTYSPAVIDRLALVRNAQRFGFSLRAIAGFLRVRESGGTPCHHVRAAAGRMLDAVDRQIAGLVAARRQMRATLRSWDAVLARTPADRPAHLLERLGRRARTASVDAKTVALHVRTVSPSVRAGRARL